MRVFEHSYGDSMSGHPPLGISARATVDRVVDGDTVDLILQMPVRVRLADCWAPEITGAERLDGAESKDFLAALLGPKEHVVLHVASGQASSLGDVLTFGRVVGRIWQEGSDVDVSRRMVAAGLATKTKEASK